MRYCLFFSSLFFITLVSAKEIGNTEILEFKASANSRLIKKLTGNQERKIYFEISKAQNNTTISMAMGSYKSKDKKSIKLGKEIKYTLIDPETCTFLGTRLMRGMFYNQKKRMIIIFSSKLHTTEDPWNDEEVLEIVSEEYIVPEEQNEDNYVEVNLDDFEVKRRADQLISDYPVHDLLSLVYAVRHCGPDKMSRFYFYEKNLLTTLTISLEKEDILKLGIEDKNILSMVGRKSNDKELEILTEIYVCRFDGKEIFRFWMTKQEEVLPLKINFRGNNLTLNRIYQLN